MKVGIGEEINSKFESNIQKLVVNLFYTTKMFNWEIQKIIEPYGIKQQHFNVLRIINGQHPEPVNPGYIKSVMLDKRRDLTRLLDKLVELKWVDRSICSGNRRKVDLLMTAEGRSMLSKINEELRKFFSFFDEMDQEKLEVLSDGVDELRNYLKQQNNNL